MSLMIAESSSVLLPAASPPPCSAFESEDMPGKLVKPSLQQLSDDLLFRALAVFGTRTARGVMRSLPRRLTQALRKLQVDEHLLLELGSTRLLRQKVLGIACRCGAALLPSTVTVTLEFVTRCCS